MYKNSRYLSYLFMLKQWPQAVAVMTGSAEYSGLGGIVRFYQTRQGVLVAAEITGLPNPEMPCENPVFGFHIHGGEECSGNETDLFANALSHFNPDACPHPHHAGDMPPLFGVNGYAFSAFLTDRFTVKDIIGKTVIIHSMPDDFTSQPSGNSGNKIACGVVSAN